MFNYEEELNICPLKDRHSIFEESVSRKVQDYKLCATKMVNPQTSLLVKVMTEIESRERKEKRNRPRSGLCFEFDRCKVYIRWDVFVYVMVTLLCQCRMQETDGREKLM